MSTDVNVEPAKMDAVLRVKMPKVMREKLDAMGAARLLAAGDVVREALVDYLRERGEWPPARKN